MKFFLGYTIQLLGDLLKKRTLSTLPLSAGVTHLFSLLEPPVGDEHHEPLHYEEEVHAGQRDGAHEDRCVVPLCVVSRLRPGVVRVVLPFRADQRLQTTRLVAIQFIP